MLSAVNDIENKIEENSGKLDDWFEGHLKNILIPLYSSVDLRISEEKIAPVDTNIFPAGFNNLGKDFWKNTGMLFKNSLSEKYPNAEKILIIPELHTKNSFYWENIRVIKTVLEDAGYEVSVGIINEDFTEQSAEFTTSSGDLITAKKVIRNKLKIKIEGFQPDIVLLNNDFSEKCPKTLRDIVQPVVPPVEMGWHTRRKDTHFEFYNSLARDVAKILDIDPWLITVETRLIENVDFDEPENRKKVYEAGKVLHAELKKEYEHRGINEEPSFFIKSNSGTYGMAVVNIKDPESIILMNSSNRKKLRVTKGGKPVRDVVIQESIPTSIKTIKGSYAEPVIYMVDCSMAGAFYRVNREKSETENLNSRGMTFEHFFGTVKGIDSLPKVFELISKVAVVAAGYEIEKIIKDGGCREAAN